MRVIYRFEIVARCPNDRLPDHYTAELECEHIIWCEAIVEYIKKFNDQKAKRHLSQEEIAVDLHRQFACKVRLVGTHFGVHTEVTA